MGHGHPVCVRFAIRECQAHTERVFTAEQRCLTINWVTQRASQTCKLSEDELCREDCDRLFPRLEPSGDQLAAASTRKIDRRAVRKTYIMIYGLIVAVHVLVCFFIIIVVLLQSGKSGDISAAFGGQGSQTAFGPRGAASALSKATTWSAVAFMITSITLSVYAARRGGPASVLQGLKSQPVKTQPAPAQAPVTPAAPQK